MKMRILFQSLEEHEKKQLFELCRHWEQEKRAAEIILTEAEKLLALEDSKIKAIKEVISRTGHSLIVGKIAVENYLKSIVKRHA